jgi:hypothetical protein
MLDKFVVCHTGDDDWDLSDLSGGLESTS